MVAASDFMSYFNPLPGGQNATPEQIKNAYAMAEALQKPSAPGQSGTFQSYGKWNALADALRGGYGGYIRGQAGQAERANLGAAAGSIPGLGNVGAAPTAAPAVGASADAGTPISDALTAGISGDTTGYLKSKEGFSATPYHDGRQTSIGYGTRAQPGDTQLSPQEAEGRLNSEAGKVNAWIDENIKVPLSPAQRTALVSFGYNLGTGSGGLSDLAPTINAGDFAAAARVMPHYNRFQGQPLDSLTQRRAEEAHMLAAPTAAPATASGGPGVMPVSQPAPQMPSGPAQQMMLGGGGVTMPPAGSGSPSGPAVPPGVQRNGIQSMMPPLPSDEQIRAMYYRGAMAGDEHLKMQAQQLYEQKRQALQPQIMATPTGHQIAFNPYQGAQDIGIPTKPMMEKFNTEVSGVGKFERPAAYSIDQNGTPFLQRIPIAGPGQAPGQAGVPPAPMGPTPTSSGYTPAGMSAVTPAAAASGGLGMNIGPGGAPTSNSQLFGEQAGPSAAGTMPDLDKASIPELQAWGARREAEQKGLDTASEFVWKSRAELHGAAISALKTIPSEMQQLAILQDAYKQPHIPGGPLAEAWSSGRALIKEVFGPKAADEVPASQVIEKTNTALSFKAAGELTSRPALIEVLAAMRANPGLKMTDQSSLYLINLMQQQKAQELQLGHMANEADNPREFISARSRFYQEHPLMSPFTGKPLQTAADFKADLDKTVAQSEPHGLGGPFMSKLGGAGQTAPQGAPAAPAPPPTSAPMRIRNEADYHALPSGVPFIDPEGQMRRKP